MKKLHDANPIGFSLIWIGLYCILMSAADGLSVAIGVEKSLTLAVTLALSGALVIFLARNRLTEQYGLCRARVKSRAMLYYLPALILLSVNLWGGAVWPPLSAATLCYVLSMFGVGFLEEVIFRGLLYNALAKQSPKTAVAVASLTFGMGHILNLLNGSGAGLAENLLQVVYASAAGFMFVMIYRKSQSLWVCIGVHGLFNALSILSAPPSPALQYLSCLALTGICVGYGVYLGKQK